MNRYTVTFGVDPPGSLPAELSAVEFDVQDVKTPCDAQAEGFRRLEAWKRERGLELTAWRCSVKQN